MADVLGLIGCSELDVAAGRNIDVSVTVVSISDDGLITVNVNKCVLLPNMYLSVYLCSSWLCFYGLMAEHLKCSLLRYANLSEYKLLF